MWQVVTPGELEPRGLLEHLTTAFARERYEPISFGESGKCSSKVGFHMLVASRASVRGQGRIASEIFVKPNERKRLNDGDCETRQELRTETERLTKGMLHRLGFQIYEIRYL